MDSVSVCVLVVFCFVTIVHAAGPSCYSCTNVYSVMDCTNVEPCTDSEQCHTQKLVDPGGNIYYKLGCMDKQLCAGAAIIGKRASNIYDVTMTTSEDYAIFARCCDGSFCNVNHTLANGHWGEWQAWHACSVTCGTGGTRYRVRTCNYATNAPKGHPCVGSSTEAQQCDTYVMCLGTTTTTSTTGAPLTTSGGSWSDWGYYRCDIRGSQCFMTRNRTCVGGSHCPGSSYEVDLCQPNKCPAFTPHPSDTSSVMTSTLPSAITSLLPVTGTSPPSAQCDDDPTFPCNSSPDVRDVACSMPSIATTQCKKTCGHCGLHPSDTTPVMTSTLISTTMSSLPVTKSTVPTSPPIDCKDVFDCSSKDARDFFCSDNALAVQFCKRTCNKCYEPNVNNTFNACHDPVLSNACPTLNQELCICLDRDIRQLCQHYCDGQCKDAKPSPIPHCATDSTHGFSGRRRSAKRAEILRRLSEFLLISS